MKTKKKELLKELDKQFSISLDYNVIKKPSKSLRIKKIDFCSIFDKKIEIN
ncbi:hypothetical protein HYE03_03920 [Mycoplasmopsis bovis]|nr:hypothetical protein [Mycoplasmopsis bovis]QQH28150.1 hypothetical protein HYE03_03920 [Mycoplasmopsis bovis]